MLARKTAIFGKRVYNNIGSKNNHSCRVSVHEIYQNLKRKYFLDFGAISELEVQADKGQAFITFDDHDSVDRAVSKKHTVSVLYRKDTLFIGCS